MLLPTLHSKDNHVARGPKNNGRKRVLSYLTLNFVQIMCINFKPEIQISEGSLSHNTSISASIINLYQFLSLIPLTSDSHSLRLDQV